MLPRILSRKGSDESKLETIASYGMQLLPGEAQRALDALKPCSRPAAISLFLKHGQIEPRDVLSAMSTLPEPQKLEVIRALASREISADLAFLFYRQMDTDEGQREAICALKERFELDQLPLLARDGWARLLFRLYRGRIYGNELNHAPDCSEPRAPFVPWTGEDDSLGCPHCSEVGRKMMALWKAGIPILCWKDVYRKRLPSPVRSPSASARHDPHSTARVPRERQAQATNARRERSGHRATSAEPAAANPSQTPVPFEFPVEHGPDAPISAKDAKGICVVCMANYYTTVNLPCMHACLCYACCAELSVQSSKKCPVCRAELSAIKKLYLT